LTKRFWIKVLSFLLIIWAVTAVISAVNTGEQGAGIIKHPSRPAAFRLVIDSLANYPNLRIRSESAVVVDLADGRVLLKKNENAVRPIASLTKLATALVFLGTSPDLSKVVTIERADREGAGRSKLYSNSQVTLNDVFHLMLISSDNVAARTISKSCGMTPDRFVAKMNELALAMNLKYTHFVEPSGLDAANVSNAAECSILLKAALDNEIIRDAMSKKNYTFRPINRKRVYTINNTNRMLFGRHDIIGGKTGYICESGYCLALVAEQDGRKLATVVLGAPTSGTRFRDAAKILAGLPGNLHTAAN
jgi:D-alanyl-D-alanine endopeptidase (penicillin-binding protein 7)